MGDPDDVPDPQNQTGQPGQTPPPDGPSDPFAGSARQSAYWRISTRSKRRRLTWLVLASISVLGISALLASCFYWTLLPSLQAFIGSQPSAAPGQAASGQATGQRTSTPLPPSDWFTGTYSGTNYRFQLDTPIVLVCTHGFFINDFSGLGCDYTYEGAPAQTALQQVEQEIRVELLSSTRITDRNICPQGGTPVRVGTGADVVTGWERDDVSTTTSNGTVTLNLVLLGTPVQLSLMGFGGQPQPFFARYGALWRHMLASFTLLPAPMTQIVHPCG